MSNDDRFRKWDDAYFHWLEPQVYPPGHQRKTYRDVLAMMYVKDFLWLVPNDDNRMVDGLDLRVEFIHESEAPRYVKPEVFGTCSVLEVLIGLSRRLAFTAGGEAEGWAWQLLVNLEFDKMSDPLTRRKVDKVSETLEALIWRRYNTDGSGGFFPLSWPEEDQTKIELWYQMSAYVDEIHSE